MLISKSTYLAGLQCEKLLWNVVNSRGRMPQPDTGAQAVFDQGKEVGAVAKRLFPDGIEVAGGIIDRQVVIERTELLLRAREPLFEAAREYAGAYARADILNPVDGDEWDLLEVKSSTSVKGVFLHDIAFQRFVFSGSGLKVRNCVLLLVSSAYRRNGRIDPEAFFARIDVTAEASAGALRIADRLTRMQNVAASALEPVKRIGPHCRNPYDCALINRCWSFLPEQNVTTLHRGAKKGFQLLEAGVTRLGDIPTAFDLTPRQTIQRAAAQTGQPQIDIKAIRRFLKQLRYPLYLLDFETFATVIPIFDGVRPYQQIPFQFSLHIVADPNEAPVHHGFLASSAGDPRRAFLDSLMPLLGDSGSIVVYNASFELGRLRECCECFPEIIGWLNRTESRVIDLLIPFRTFAYYHPDQAGSASIKAVLPAITGEPGYDELAISDGGQASREFVRVTFGDVTVQERERVRSQLQEYCALDTLAMWRILRAIRARS